MRTAREPQLPLSAVICADGNFFAPFAVIDFFGRFALAVLLIVFEFIPNLHCTAKKGFGRGKIFLKNGANVLRMKFLNAN